MRKSKAFEQFFIVQWASFTHSPTVPVFVVWSQGCTKPTAQTLPRLFRSIIFIELLYIAPVCAKRLSVCASIRCVVSIFHFFPLVCPVFIDWSEGCTKTSVQTLPGLLRSIIFIELLYIAPICAKWFRVCASIHCVVSIFHPFPYCARFHRLERGMHENKCPNLTRALT